MCDWGFLEKTMPVNQKTNKTKKKHRKTQFPETVGYARTFCGLAAEDQRNTLRIAITWDGPASVHIRRTPIQLHSTRKPKSNAEFKHLEPLKH